MRPVADVLIEIAWRSREAEDEPHLHRDLLASVQRLAPAAFRRIPRRIEVTTLQPGLIDVPPVGAVEHRVVFDGDDEASCVHAVIARLAGAAPAILVRLAGQNPELAPELLGEAPVSEPTRALVASYAIRSLHNEAMSCLRRHGVPDDYVRTCRDLIALGVDVEPLVVEATHAAATEAEELADDAPVPGREHEDPAVLRQLDLVWELSCEVVEAAAGVLAAKAADNLRRSVAEVVALGVPPSLLAHLGLEPVTMDALIHRLQEVPAPKGSKPWKQMENRLHKRHRDARGRLLDAADRLEAADELSRHEAELVRRWLRGLLRRKPKEA